MRTELGHEQRFRQENTPRNSGHSYSAGVTCSDTMRADSRVPSVPFWDERRPTEHAAPWSTEIPCFRYLHCTINFPFWIQPVAAASEELLRLLKNDSARPDKAGGKMAKYCHDSIRLHSFFTGIPQTQDAASKANSEVSTCR